MIFLMMAIHASGYLIASTSLESCTSDGLLNCTDKLLVSLSLQNAQDAKTESLEVIIDEVSTNSTTKSLLQPIKLTFSKSRVSARYELRYLLDFNSKPIEMTVFSSIWDCEDDAYAKDPTCGWRYDSYGEKIWDSQGFCCKCDFGEIIGIDSDNHNRGNTCQAFNLGEGSATAHCLEWDELWYSSYEISSFTTFYTLRADITFPDQSGNYTGESLEVSPSKPVDSNSDIVLRLIGDFYPNDPPPSLSHYFLFAASRPTGHSHVRLGSKYWMFIDKDDVSFDGTECNKVGTSYSAFRNQRNACGQKAQSCLGSQLKDKHEEDLQRLMNNRKPLYFIQKEGNFSMILDGTKAFLQLNLQGRFSSLATVEIAGDHLRFITSVSTGTIDYAAIENFEALSYDGLLLCQVTNTGNVHANFILSSHCNQGVSPVQALELSLSPLESYLGEYDIYVENTIQSSYYCNVTLYNALGEMLDFEVAYFNTSNRNTDIGTQGGTGDVDGDLAADQDVANSGCSSVCPSWYDIACFLVNGCWAQILFFIGIIVGFVLIVILIKFVVKKYGICCQKLCKGPKEENRE